MDCNSWYDRDLAFANLALLTFWGVLWPTLPGRATRVTVAFFVGGLCLHSTWLNECCVRKEKSRIADVAKYLRAQYRPGDIVVLSDPMTLNCLRYYAFQAGLLQIAMRCPIDHADSIHYTQAAALDECEVLDPVRWSSESCALRNSCKVRQF